MIIPKTLIVKQEVRKVDLVLKNVAEDGLRWAAIHKNTKGIVAIFTFRRDAEVFCSCFSTQIYEICELSEDQ